MNPDGSKAASRAESWDFFDRIYCMSLQDREDRRQAAQAQFSHVGLDGKVEFVIVDRHPSDTEQGIYESHMTCLRKGLQAGAEHIVVFEDDILFDRYDADRFKQCTRFLSTHPDWKVLLLGALIRSSKKTSVPCLQHVEYGSLAHAYAVNRPYAETLAYVPWQGIAVDTLFRPPTDHVYAVYPMFAFQSDFSSDNEKYLRLDRFRRWCGGLERIQKALEFYHRRKVTIIVGHFLAATAALFACFH
jgi:GR25 family glycosyltransferase involved in LPS biosynthesis